MKEYVERQLAENKLGEAMPKLKTPDGRGENDYEIEIAQESFVDAIGVIHNIPAAEVVEVVHGKWIYLDDGDWECSNCKEPFVICVCGKDRTWKHPYCPSCGAKMDLEEYYCQIN